MLYSEFLVEIKSLITTENKFICPTLASIYVQSNFPQAHIKKLQKKVKELVTKSHRDSPLQEYKGAIALHLNYRLIHKEENINEFQVRMKHDLLDRMIRSALKREAKASQKSLF